MGIRGRIALTISLITALATALLGLAVHELTDRERQTQARSLADDRLAAALKIHQQGGVLPPDATTDANAIPARLRRAVAGGGAATYIDKDGDDPRAWAAAQAGRDILTVSLPYASAYQAQRFLGRALVAAGALTTVVTTVLAAAAAQGLSRRLRTSAAAARLIAAGYPPDGPDGAPLREGPRHDEAAELGRAVHDMAVALAERVAGEQRFTADVAHELRTPVAGLVAACELLDDSFGAELTRDRAQALRHLVEDLLEISRLDAGVEHAERESVHLPDLVATAVARTVRDHDLDSDHVVLADTTRTGESARPRRETESDEVPVVRTDPRRLERIVANLLANAARHGHPPIEVTTDDHRITIRDHGPGFPDDLLTHGPRRFRTAAPARGTGHGLGLTIATGQARVLDAQLTFHNAVDGGALVVLELPRETDAPGNHPPTTPRED
ncbi:Sensor protein CseC [Streptomyces sp. YIM 130001]|uniref:sensor histidine kinase n=1 Tax=Streptomyces sp. YIM 130001 TaxID=2259644 RepID=UPI000E6469A8|nr:HAMP domain-containing sensor histidine kinase [Streptomyces sp. YIM 130001]RII08668.1 Sensor protein CseC [Streptomyces sp. YIM 130001]